MGCRGREPQSALLRFVADPGQELRLDSERRLPGRGAYLHARSECVEQALKRRSLGRALKTRLGPAADGVVLVALASLDQARGEGEGAAP
ncbi:MAG TPA: YlxR family protein [Candidatus Acidoferrales bacterium]|nr:YlxR family protein [Candidatus Acidoferrales bacterium]